MGIDIIPAQPPRGANALQGNFLSEEIREEVRRFVRDPGMGRVRQRGFTEGAGVTEEELAGSGGGILQLERQSEIERMKGEGQEGVLLKEGLSQKELDGVEGRCVDVVLSDMSEPWPLVHSKWVRSVSNPYFRMQNTSGMPFRVSTNIHSS